MSRIIKAFDRAALAYDHWYEQPKGRQVFEAELKAVRACSRDQGTGLRLGRGPVSSLNASRPKGG